MWQQIKSNRLNSLTLVIASGMLMGALGYGATLVSEPKVESLVGILLAEVVWVVVAAVGYFLGGPLVVAMLGGRQVDKSSHRQLFNVVDEMHLAAGIPIPKVFVLDERSMNAFAAGQNPRNALIAVTRGLLETLNRDELQGVVAHEMAHIRNGCIRAKLQKLRNYVA